MISIDWQPGAREDLNSALAFYGEVSRALGILFLDSLEEALERIARFPLSGRAIGKRDRCLLLKRFPYSLIYRIESRPGDSQFAMILAVAHQKRRPQYWSDR